MYNSSNPKIDIYFKGVYVCSTNYARTCKEAKELYAKLSILTVAETADVKCKKAK